MKRIAIIILTLISSVAAAQDLTSVLLDMRKQYEDMKNLHIVMDVLVFEERDANVPYYELKVDIKKEGDNYLYKFGSNEMLLNGKYLIMADHQSKEIVVTNRDHKSEAAMKKNFQFNLDTIMTFYEDVKYVGSSDGISHYRLVQKTGMVKTIEIYIDSKAKLLKKITYEYSSKQFVSIVFTLFQINPLLQSDVFDETQYVYSSQKTVSPSTQYKTYNVTVN